MQITQVIAFLAVAIVGAVATPIAPPPPPSKPGSVAQKVNCDANSTPYCCSPSASVSGGTTCILINSSINCDGIVTCCSENGGISQSCLSSIFGPNTFVYGD
ncbi:hypothetical protein V8E54_007160 [Elaphomyces granulatus]